MIRCPECLNGGVQWLNAVPMYELTGDREEDASYCPHCGADCDPFGISSFYTTAAKLPPNSKFKVAGKGAYFE